MFNKGVSTVEYQPGIEKTVMLVLGDCPGRDNAISRAKLLAIVQSAHPKTTDRQLRACVNKLRKDGQMICSTGGEDGGYWISVDWSELDEYLICELHSRAMDLLEQESKLRQAAEQKWGKYSKQFKLFG